MGLVVVTILLAIYLLLLRMVSTAGAEADGSPM